MGSNILGLILEVLPFFDFFLVDVPNIALTYPVLAASKAGKSFYPYLP